MNGIITSKISRITTRVLQSLMSCYRVGITGARLYTEQTRLLCSLGRQNLSAATLNRSNQACVENGSGGNVLHTDPGFVPFGENGRECRFRL